LHETGRLTTHVLDTARGRPAEGLAVTLHRLDAAGRTVLTSARTNADGRLDAPLLDARTIARGRYELDFAAADYHRAQGYALADPPFLDIVTIRFAIAEPDRHYHVPLLLTPWSYATYRGS
jgi:hydroxyisourate hydrolase